MKALVILQEQYKMLGKDIDGVWIDPEKIDEAIAELEDYGIKKAMYENILTLIDIECKKQALSEASSYELKLFSKVIRNIILNNYVTSIDMSKENLK